MRSRVWRLAFYLLVLNSSVSFAVTQPRLQPFRAAHVIAASSPDNDFEILQNLIDTARSSIKISVYQLENQFLADSLEKALSRGVSITILLDGSPVSGISDAEFYIVKTLIRKGAKIFFYDDPDGRDNRTYKFIHAKYGIFDSNRVLVGSGNYGTRGHPVDTTTGNREWEVLLDDPKAAKIYESIFNLDRSIKNEWARYGTGKYQLNDPQYEPSRKTLKGKYRLHLSFAEANGVSIEPVFAPDNAVEAITSRLVSAGSTVDIEQLDFQPNWNKEKSPFLTGVLRLASQGRVIRVLLNDDHIFGDPVIPKLMSLMGIFFGETSSQHNPETMQILNEEAQKHRWNLEVRLLNYKRCGLLVLHNKGMILDRQAVLVGSLNWGQSALTKNREAGVFLENATLAAYYEKAFDYDWNCSAIH